MIRILISVSILFLSLTSCKTKVYYYNEIEASKRALEFCKHAYMLLDIERAQKYLHAIIKNKITEEGMLEVVSKMHPYGTPITLSVLSYIPLPDNTLNIFIQGINEIDSSFYLINMSNIDSDDYLVSGLHLIDKSQYDKDYSSNSMLLNDNKTVRIGAIKYELNNNFKNQILRKKYLYKRDPKSELVINLSNGHKITLENIFQIYYSSENNWTMIMKYRSEISQNNSNKIVEESKIIWNEYFKNIVEESAVSGAVLLSVENIIPEEDNNRSQYGVVYKKNTTGIWETVSKI